MPHLHEPLDRAAHAKQRLAAIPGVELAWPGPTFNEFAVRLAGRDARDVVDACKARGVHPGYELARDLPWVGRDALLVAVTEQHTESDVERLATTIAEVLA